MARAADPCVLTSNIVVACSVKKCWDIYIENALLPDWAPAVSQVDCNSDLLDLNVIRKSTVSFDNKDGHTVEQCCAFEPLKRIEFSVLEETFGFSHMLNSYSFGVSFDVEGDDTLLIMHTHYVPKKIFGTLMTSKATQQQLLNVMSDTLNGFKRFAEAK